MQSIELLLEAENNKDLLKAIKLYQYLKGDISLLDFLEAQLKRHLTDDQISEIEEEVESIFNKLHFDILDPKNEASTTKVHYEFDIAEIKGLLKQAIKKNKDIEIEYFNLSNDNFKKYKIRPDQISGSMLDAFYYKKNQNKVFRIARIKTVDLL